MPPETIYLNMEVLTEDVKRILAEMDNRWNKADCAFRPIKNGEFVNIEPDWEV